MATTGRKPTPTHLKLIRGNPGKRKLPDPAKEIRAPLEEPTPPPHLSDEAKVEWGRIISVLVQLKLMTSLDRAMLAAYCEAYGRWVQAERALRAMAEEDPLTSGLMITTISGNIIQNPMVGTANKAMADMVRYATEFGMSPSARVRLQNPGSSVDENPFDSFTQPRRKSGAT